jgi:hypothetical protein
MAALVLQSGCWQPLMQCGGHMKNTYQSQTHLITAGRASLRFDTSFENFVEMVESLSSEIWDECDDWLAATRKRLAILSMTIVANTLGDLIVTDVQVENCQQKSAKNKTKGCKLHQSSQLLRLTPSASRTHRETWPSPNFHVRHPLGHIGRRTRLRLTSLVFTLTS